MSLPADPAAHLATAFFEVRRLQPDRPVLLMLDEAQTLGRGGAGDAAMKAIRALFNSHPGGCCCFFRVPPRPSSSRSWRPQQDGFQAGGPHGLPRSSADREIAVTEMDWAFSQLLHRPGEMIDFARFLVTETPGASVAESMHAFKLRNRPDVGFEAQFEVCTPLQRAVLLQAARDRKLFSKETRDQIARYMGEAQAFAPASVYNALTQLEAKGILAKLEGRVQYQFEDDHPRTWLNVVARH